MYDRRWRVSDSTAAEGERKLTDLYLLLLGETRRHSRENGTPIVGRRTFRGRFVKVQGESQPTAGDPNSCAREETAMTSRYGVVVRNRPDGGGEHK